MTDADAAPVHDRMKEPSFLISQLEAAETLGEDEAGSIPTAELRALVDERDEARASLAEASRLWDGPETSDWIEGVRKEAAHQRARWGTQHDAGKTPADWFWLLGYLAGKALHAAITGDVEKARHHTISSGAALLNWHASLSAPEGPNP